MVGFLSSRMLSGGGRTLRRRISGISGVGAPVSESTDAFVTMTTYHSDWKILIGVFLSGCISTIGANTYITTKQLEGMARRIEGDVGIQIGNLRGDVGRIEGRIGNLDGRIMALETMVQVNFNEIKRELDILVNKGAGRKEG